MEKCGRTKAKQDEDEDANGEQEEEEEVDQFAAVERKLTQFNKKLTAFYADPMTSKFLADTENDRDNRNRATQNLQ